MKTKIVLPTDDKISINGCFTGSAFFKVTSVENWKIVKEEYRENRWADQRELKSGENLTTRVYELISDCDIFLTNAICNEFANYLESVHKEIAIITETNITTAVYEFLKESCLKESNSCCCP